MCPLQFGLGLFVLA